MGHKIYFGEIVWGKKYISHTKPCFCANPYSWYHWLYNVCF